MRKLLLIAGIAALSIPCLSVAGQLGYYDEFGVYHGNTPVATPYGAYAAPAASDYGADTSYDGGGLNAREGMIAQQITDGASAGALSPDDARQAFHDLRGIRRDEDSLMNDHDGLTNDDRGDIWRRLNDLSARVSEESGGD